MHVKPAEGRVVIDPATGKPLSTEGQKVPANQFWLRRRACGDVVETKPKTRKPAK